MLGFGRFDPLDLPLGPARVANDDAPLRRASLRSPQVDQAGIEHDVCADVAMDGKLHFGRERPIEFHLDGDVLLPLEIHRVDVNDDFGFLPGLDDFSRNFRRRAAAACRGRLDMRVLQIDVLQREAVLDLCAAGNRAEIVARVVKHFASPIVGASRGCRGQHGGRQKGPKAKADDSFHEVWRGSPRHFVDFQVGNRTAGWRASPEINPSYRARACALSSKPNPRVRYRGYYAKLGKACQLRAGLPILRSRRIFTQLYQETAY